MTTYCDFVRPRPTTDVHRHYHDHDYGFPLHDDNALFERLVLEINQAGLSWETILKKKENFQRAYGRFEVDAVAAYTEADRERLLSDAGIIRNKLKVNAAIENARRIVALRKDYGSFKGWLDAHHPLTKDEWVKVFKKQFVFVGGEIVNEMLMSTGYLPGAHAESCEIYAKIAKLKPPWMQPNKPPR
jgi:DNA-3-methyladenine glycosylase I